MNDRAIITYREGARFTRISSLIDNYYPKMNSVQRQISMRILNHQGLLTQGLVNTSEKSLYKHALELLGYIELLQYTCLPSEELFELRN